LSFISAILSLRKKADMGSGPVMRTLVFMSVPAIAMAVSNTLCHLIDTIFVSWLGEAHILAISFTFPVQIGIFAVLEGVGNGVTSLVARRLGANRLFEARNIAIAGIAFAYALSMLFIPIMIPGFSDRLFTALGAENADVLRYIWLYNVWVPPTIVAICYGFMCNCMFRCQGNTVVPLIYMLVTNITNLVLDPIFIFTFDWGITGASAATFLSRIAGGAYAMRKLRTDSDIRIPLKPYFRVRMLKTWAKIFSVGLPVTISTGSVALGMGTVNKILAGAYGPQAVAGWMVGIRVEDLAGNTIMGIQNALVPFLGFNYGRRDLPRMKQGITAACKIVAAFTGTLMLIIFLFPHTAIALFRPSAAVAAIAAQSIRITFIGYPAAAFSLIINCLFTSTGHTIYGMIVQIMRSLVFRIFAISLLASRVSVHSVWWFQPIAFTGAALVSLFFASVLMRKLKRDLGDDGKTWLELLK